MTENKNLIEVKDMKIHFSAKRRQGCKGSGWNYIFYSERRNIRNCRRKRMREKYAWKRNTYG